MYVWHLKSSIICIFVHTKRLFSVCLTNVTVLKCCLLLTYRKVRGRVLRRIRGAYFISPPSWLEWLWTVWKWWKSRKKNPKNPARLTQVCLYWATGGLTVLDMFSRQIKVTLWSEAYSLSASASASGFGFTCPAGGEPGKPGSMMDGFLIDIVTENHSYLWWANFGSILKDPLWGST